MKNKMLSNNLFTPLVTYDEWIKEFPKVDREYVWSYPLYHGPNAFDPRDIFMETDIPITSYDTVVYIHVPACLFRCPMCPFYVEIIKSRKELGRYFEAIIKEIKMYKMAALTKKLNLKTIYFGGGTASLLYPEEIERIIQEIKKVIPYNGEIEITVEGHPSTVDYNYLSALKEIGVNRVSFGIQTFCDCSLKTLGLHQTSKQNERVLKDCVNLGFKTVAADLLYRLPNQNINDLKEQLEKFINIGVNSISAYSLELSVRQSAIEKIQPTEAEDQSMFYVINDYLTSKGWDHTAQPDYAKNGHIQQEILTTWKAPQGQTIGLGAGASSVFNGNTYCNVHNIEEYKNAISEQCLPVLIGQKFTIEDAMSRYVVLGVRCFKIPYKEFREIFNCEFRNIYRNEIEKLKSFGLVEEKDDSMIVTKKGKYYVDNISKEFYSVSNRCRLQPWGEKMQGLISQSYLKVKVEEI